MDTRSIPRVGPQFDPAHPGEVIEMTYLEDGGLTITALAAALNVSPSTLSRIVSGKARISADMAIRLEKVLGPSATSWLRMQAAYDEWQARQHCDLTGLHRLTLQAA